MRLYRRSYTSAPSMNVISTAMSLMRSTATAVGSSDRMRKSASFLATLLNPPEWFAYLCLLFIHPRASPLTF